MTNEQTLEAVKEQARAERVRAGGVGERMAELMIFGHTRIGNTRFTWRADGVIEVVTEAEAKQ
jgi:hypothetical protein